jgi:lysozyme
MRKINKAGLELIKHFEGYYAKPYICPAGYLTVGYGHLVTKKEKGTLLFLTEQESSDLLGQDLVRYEKSVEKLLKMGVNENQFSALVSFAYNLGSGSLSSSTLLRKINRNEYAADEFRKWIYGGGRILKGLIRRREAERSLFLS